MHDVITKDKALSKAMGYCAYRERSSFELIERLKKWGVMKAHISEITQYLIEEKFIDDQRFTNAFISGKFSQNKWGRVKISIELRSKGISKEMILKGMNEISDKDYQECLQKLSEDKIKNTKGKNTYVIQNKVANYLQRKGFESELIWKAINDLQ